MPREPKIIQTKENDYRAGRICKTIQELSVITYPLERDILIPPETTIVILPNLYTIGNKVLTSKYAKVLLLCTIPEFGNEDLDCVGEVVRVYPKHLNPTVELLRNLDALDWKSVLGIATGLGINLEVIEELIASKGINRALTFISAMHPKTKHSGVVRCPICGLEFIHSTMHVGSQRIGCHNGCKDFQVADWEEYVINQTTKQS